MAATAATCIIACRPVPTNAISSASGSASTRVAKPEMPDVRSAPRSPASISASRRPSCASNNEKVAAAPAGVFAQVLTPA